MKLTNTSVVLLSSTPLWNRGIKSHNYHRDTGLPTYLPNCTQCAAKL